MASNASSTDQFSASTSSIKDLSTTPEDEIKTPVGKDGSSRNKPAPPNACSMCRKRKIKCDGLTPSCGRCTRMKLDCAYEETRKKSGPRKGYVRGLQTRLAQAEELLKKQGVIGSENDTDKKLGTSEPERSSSLQDFETGAPLPASASDGLLFSSTHVPEDFMTSNPVEIFPNDSQDGHMDAFLTDDFSWAMIELGVHEPLPPQDIIDELTQIFFSKIHPSVPIIHQYRFLADRPPVSLRYAMWALAATITPKYSSLHPHFHLRARKYAELDETSGRGKYINIRHAQAWLLIGLYEFKMMMFPNAWMTTGRATRLTQLLGLYRLDGLGVEFKQTLPRETDIGEMEERRRTFWMAFCMDRYAGVGTGWPLIIDEKDILTHLPCSEEAYELNIPGPGISLGEAMNPINAPILSPFAGVAVVASLTGRILQHLQRPDSSNADEVEDTNSTFWRNHRQIDSTLLNMSLFLPAHLRLPAGSSNANTIFLNMSMQCSIICLHQSAIFKGEKLANQAVVRESKIRCLAAGMEIASIMKRIAHTDLSTLSVYTPFSLYLGVRIFALVLKEEPNNEDAISNMRFLLAALVAMKETNPLCGSYLIQLDLEGIGISSLQENIRDFSGLERAMASMNVQEPCNDAEWITFVSPLVRIVEETGKSASSPTNSRSAREGSNLSDDPKGKRAMSSETMSFGMPRDIAADGPSLGLDGVWSSDLPNMQEDLFDSIMDFGGNK